ncbi:hypothetical protein D187_003504 [Cystobacter fuscus DSM 2262]|uniref:DUF4276 family protein n=1 Tax=Cystobacter fuscus (strain ATCC 25194 / DSM 2262 / NBRC 100088 / M29) TaxID=1242864 RepID=S9QBU1_CYSF2|nr:DUF4276 family protein [Cystobacter fuscus]EPX58789.1 hypothetical protein D187_003504 [Cystobacter fuscus DSM 2262]
MNRLVCIVEGHGEVEAIPSLCYLVMGHLGVTGWFVDKEPIRQPRSEFVDGRPLGPKRPARDEGLIRAMKLVRSRKAQAALLLCDEDDDCAATWGPDASERMRKLLPNSLAVMAVREYETWLLLARGMIDLGSLGIYKPEKIRDAKKAMRLLVPGYLPTTHQLSETRGIDVAFLRSQSRSFDKFVRSIEMLCATTGSVDGQGDTP